MNDKINFLQSFKGKTVDEVIKIREETEKQSNKNQAVLQQKKIEWYKNCIGKYFVIKHNDTAFSLVHIKEKEIPKEKVHYTIDPRYNNNNPLYFLAWECYHIVLNTKIEANAGFNVLWLGNPFEGRTMSFATCKEITKEKFEEITSPFNSLIDKSKQLLK